MAETTNFRLIVTVVFGFFIMAGVMYLVIAPPKKGEIRGSVTVWGTLGEKMIGEVLSPIDSGAIEVTYVKMSEDEYADELIESFASGQGPDVFLLTDSMIVRFRDKIYPFPTSSMTERDFRNMFIEEGELLLKDGTVSALPLVVDPILLYWNRDTFSSSGISSVPASWTEVLSSVLKLTQYSDKGEIIRPAVALGEFSNIEHAKEILITLFLQTGSGVVVYGDGGLTLDFASDAAQSVVRFYTEFARPGKDIYTWNRSMRSDRELFASGDLPMYVGYASERVGIAERNPHLNFDIAPIPQLSDGGRVSTYGKLYAVAVSKQTKNAPAALLVASRMATAESSMLLADLSGMAPTYRAHVGSADTKDPYRPIVDSAALVARSWLDPDPEMSYTVFEEMIVSITGGRARLSEAVYTMQQELLRYIKDRGLGTGIK